MSKTNKIVCEVCNNTYPYPNQFCPVCGWEEMMFLSDVDKDFDEVQKQKVSLLQSNWKKQLEHSNEINELNNKIVELEKTVNSSMVGYQLVKIIEHFLKADTVYLKTDKQCKRLPNLNIMITITGYAGQMRVTLIDQDVGKLRNRFKLKIPGHFFNSITKMTGHGFDYKIEFASHDFVHSEEEKNRFVFRFHK